VGRDLLQVWKTLSPFRGLVEELMKTTSLKPYPIREIEDFNDNENVGLYIKLEHNNAKGDDPLRTVKRKPAAMMVAATAELNSDGKLWISASSGNFVQELGIFANELGRKLVAVVPPRISQQKLRNLLGLGIDAVKVTEEEYDLCPREFTVLWVRAVTHRIHKLVNIDQYNSLLNPLAHILMTSQEIEQEIGKDLTHIFVPLGSTGTFAGIDEYFSRFHPNVQIIGVQPTRNHYIPGVHHVMGECKWSPEVFNLPNKETTKILTIDDKAAYSALIELEMRYGICGGPSTGMVFAAVKQEASNLKDANVLFLSPDSSWDYGEWNKAVLTDPKLGIRDAIDEADVSEYIKAIERREEHEARLERIRRIYSSPREGRLYTLEDFEKTVDSL